VILRQSTYKQGPPYRTFTVCSPRFRPCTTALTLSGSLLGSEPQVLRFSEKEAEAQFQGRTSSEWWNQNLNSYRADWRAHVFKGNPEEG
jgi:hypothetical protein